SAVSQAVANVRPGSSPAVYAKAIAGPTVQILVSSGSVNSNNVKQVASTLSENLVREMANTARRYRVNVPDASVQADVSMVTSMTSTMVISTQTSVQMGGDSGFPGGDAGFPGGDAGYPGGDAGFPAGGDYPEGGAPSDLGGPSGSGSLGGQLTSTLASALTKTNTLKAISASKPSANIAVAISTSGLKKALLALRISGGPSSQITSAVSQAVANVRPGSSPAVYAKAIAGPTVQILVSSGSVNSNNVKQVASTLSENLVREMANTARRYRVNVPDASVQADVSMVTSMTSTMVISTQTSVQMGGDSGFPGGDAGFPGGDAGYPGGDAGFPAGGDYPEGGAPSDLGGPSGSGSLGGQLTSTLASALTKTNTLKAISASKPSANIAVAISTSGLKKALLALRISGGPSSQITSAVSQAVANVRPGSSPAVYAKAIAGPTVQILVSSGSVNSNNVKQVASTLSENLVREMANTARRYRVNVPDASVQADVSMVTSMTSTMVISTQTSVQMGGDSGFPGGDAGFPGGDAGYPGGDAGFPAGGDYPEGGAPSDLGGPSGSGSLGGQLTSTLASALTKTNTLKAISASKPSANIAVAISTSGLKKALLALRISGGPSSQITSAVSQAVANVRPGSSPAVYAKAIAGPTVQILVSSGSVNSNNVKQVASTLSENLVREMANTARRYRVNVPDASVQADVSMVTSMTSTMVISTQTSVQMGGDSGFPGGDAGFPGGDAGYPGGDAGFPAGGDYPEGGAPSDLGGPSGSGSLGGQLTSTLASALTKTNTLKAISASKPSANIAVAISTSGLKKALLALRISGGPSSQITSAVSQAVANVRPGSSPAVYAKAIAGPTVQILVSSGSVNSNNVKQVASTLSENLVREMANTARRYRVNVPDASVQADVSMVTSMTSTMVISTQTSVQMGGDSGFPGGDAGFPGGDAGYPGGDAGFPAGGDYPEGGAPSDLGGPSGSGSLGGQLTSTLASALTKTNTLKAISASKPSANIAVAISTSGLKKALLALRISGGPSSQITSAVSQAVANVRPGSSPAVYAKAIAGPTVQILVSSGSVNSNNLKQVASTLSENLVREMANTARRYRVNVPDSAMQADVNIVSSMTSTLTSFSQTLDVSDSSSSFGLGLPAADGGSPGSGMPSFGLVLNSPNGLRSPQAKARINNLASALSTAVGPKGVDVNAFTSGLRASLSNLGASGMSPNEAKVEVLLEALTAALQLLSSSTLGVVDTSSIGLTSNSVSKAVSVILA
ncbi:aciniform spidroin 1A variant 1, partial [Trichonephila inaurata madagascariensis]